MKLIFLDLETTGLDPSKDEIIQAAYKTEEELLVHSEIYKATKLIPYEISGLTNIDRKDVENKGFFKDSKEKQELLKYAKKDYILVAHNTDFDAEFLRRNGVNFKKEICTLMIAKKIIKKELANHKLGTLRAYYKIPVPGKNNPHDAAYDVEVLFEIYKKLKKNFSDEDEMINLTKEARDEYLRTWRFGKFKGEKVNVKVQIDYIKWYLNQPSTDKYPKDPKFVKILEEEIKGVLF